MGAWLKRIALTRRQMLAVVFALLVITLVLPIPIPLAISADVKKSYDALNALPAGSLVFVGIRAHLQSWYDGAMFPPWYAVVAHIFKAKLRAVFINDGSGSYTEAAIFTQLTVDKVAPNAKYGVDYVIFPVLTGGESSVIAWTTDIPGTTPYDYKGNSVKDLEITKDLKTAADFVFAISAGWGSEMVGSEMRYFQGRYGTPFILVCSDAYAPGFRQYVQSGQAVGIVHGAGKGAEYEKLVGVFGQGLASLAQYNVTCAVFLVLLVIANIATPRRRVM